MQETIKKHPSYGMLSFHRVHGAATPLFGSSVQHRDTIRLTLKEGEVKRSLNTDWYFGGKQLFEVEMSLSQFAELITSLNMGDGIPVTILSTETQRKIESCPFESKAELHQKEFQEHLRKTYEKSQTLLQQVKERLSTKKALTKKEKEEMLTTLTTLSYDIGSNVDFQFKQFQKQMEKTVQEAKGEIEAFYQNRVMEASKQGLQLQGNPVNMIEVDNEEIGENTDEQKENSSYN
jgi:hypothetical protein